MNLRIQLLQIEWIQIYFTIDLNSSFNICLGVSLIEQAQAISNPIEYKYSPFPNMHVSDPQQPSWALYKKHTFPPTGRAPAKESNRREASVNAVCQNTRTERHWGWKSAGATDCQTNICTLSLVSLGAVAHTSNSSCTGDWDKKISSLKSERFKAGLGNLMKCYPKIKIKSWAYILVTEHIIPRTANECMYAYIHT